jgi:hypothetical protein
MENQTNYMEVSKYIIKNDTLLFELIHKFNETFSYSYFELIKKQIHTIINQKRDIENILVSTKFNRNKKILLINLEIIEIMENLLFEYNRLLLDSNQDPLILLELQVEENNEALISAKEKINGIKEKVNGYEKLNIDIPQEIFVEIESIFKEVEKIKYKNGEIDILSIKISINNNAKNRINSLLEKLNTVYILLNDEIQKSIDYIEWRIKFPL